MRLPFADVPAAHWAYEDIRLLYGLKLLEGKSDRQFAPGDKASRAEMAVLLDRVLTRLNG
ncbi:S-layer homology domain-containing protein [Paenibacillus thailandensis]|uniref:S-layer homology domain-containing protein n=1 Tax=Paenibacillus thailandensis TaxID=393250 RepID=UPI00363C2E8F